MRHLLCVAGFSHKCLGPGGSSAAAAHPDCSGRRALATHAHVTPVTASSSFPSENEWVRFLAQDHRGALPSRELRSERHVAESSWSRRYPALHRLSRRCAPVLEQNSHFRPPYRSGLYGYFWSRGFLGLPHALRPASLKFHRCAGAGSRSSSVTVRTLLSSAASRR